MVLFIALQILFRICLISICNSFFWHTMQLIGDVKYYFRTQLRLLVQTMLAKKMEMMNGEVCSISCICTCMMIHIQLHVYILIRAMHICMTVSFLVGIPLLAEVVTLPMILSFFTGSESIPPLGFPHDPVLNFSDTSIYPTASTCAIQLTLPLCYTDYDKFKDALTMGFRNHGGFGLS